MAPGRVGALAAFVQRFAALAALRTQVSSAEKISDPDLGLERATSRASEKAPPELIWDFDTARELQSANQVPLSRQRVGGVTRRAPREELGSTTPASAGTGTCFDYPAAALRWLAGRDERFRASGARTCPTLVTGLDHGGRLGRATARSALTDDESFLRARRGGLPLARVRTSTTRALFLSAGWRATARSTRAAPCSARTRTQVSHLQLQPRPAEGGGR